MLYHNFLHSSTFKALFVADFAEINERANSTDYPGLIMHVLSAKLHNIWLRCGCSAQVIAKILQVCSSVTIFHELTLLTNSSLKGKL